MVLSTSNLVKIFAVRYAPRDTLSMAVGQLDRKWKYGGLSAIFCLSIKYLGNRRTDLRQLRGEDVFVPRSDEFECQIQRSRSPGTKTRYALPSPPAATEWNALTENSVTHQQTGPFRRCRAVISAACVRSVFGKTSLCQSMSIAIF